MPDPVADAEASGDRLFVVTTRSRLKSVRFFPSMLIASGRIRRQLRDSGDVVRWASVVAGPTEFWTITAWRNRHAMQEFMRSGAHDQIMWLFARWLRSFWLMRWRPGAGELGSWRGQSFTPTQAADDMSSDPTSAARRALLDQALAELPRLRAATGPTGAATYDSSPAAERRRAEVGQAAGAILRLEVAPWRTLGALVALRRLRAECAADDGLLRAAVGIGRPGEVYFLGLWAEAAGAAALLASARVRALHGRLGDGCWAIAWTPENEFGHWDGLRVRRDRIRRGLTMTPDAAALGELESPTGERVSWRRGAGVRRDR